MTEKSEIYNVNDKIFYVDEKEINRQDIIDFMRKIYKFCFDEGKKGVIN